MRSASTVSANLSLVKLSSRVFASMLETAMMRPPAPVYQLLFSTLNIMLQRCTAWRRRVYRSDLHIAPNISDLQGSRVSHCRTSISSLSLPAHVRTHNLTLPCIKEIDEAKELLFTWAVNAPCPRRLVHHAVQHENVQPEYLWNFHFIIACEFITAVRAPGMLA